MLCGLLMLLHSSSNKPKILYVGGRVWYCKSFDVRDSTNFSKE